MIWWLSLSNKKLSIYGVILVVLIALFILKNFKFIFENDILDIKKQLVLKNIELQAFQQKLKDFKAVNIHTISDAVIATISATDGVKLTSMYKDNELLKVNVKGRYENISRFIILLETQLKHVQILFVSFNEDTLSLSIKFVDKQVKSLKKLELKHVLYPFEKKQKIQKKKIVKPEAKQAVLKLEAIMNNSVKINGAWYRLFENIKSWRVVHIAQSYVRLKHIKTKKFKKLLF